MLAQEADRFSVEQAIQELRSKKGGTWLSYANTDRQLKESYEQIRLMAWRLILFVGLIGILNVSNTVYTNIHTRVAEIGMHPTIGMSAGSLYKTFLWGAYYGVIASVIGAAGGYSGHFSHDTVQGFSRIGVFLFAGLWDRFLCAFAVPYQCRSPPTSKFSPGHIENLEVKVMREYSLIVKGERIPIYKAIIKNTNMRDTRKTWLPSRNTL